MRCPLFRDAVPGGAAAALPLMGPALPALMAPAAAGEGAPPGGGGGAAAAARRWEPGDLRPPPPPICPVAVPAAMPSFGAPAAPILDEGSGGVEGGAVAPRRRFLHGSGRRDPAPHLPQIALDHNLIREIDTEGRVGLRVWCQKCGPPCNTFRSVAMDTEFFGEHAPVHYLAAWLEKAEEKGPGAHSDFYPERADVEAYLDRHGFPVVP